jgi:uncharacterized membrane protein
MGEYRGEIAIDRPAAEVFGFLSDIRNMPRYLPTVRKAEPRDGGKVAMEGEAGGHAYQDEGWLKLDNDAMRMRWGSARKPDYAGSIEVREAGSGAAVALSLSLTPEPDVAARMEQESGAVDHAMRRAMQRTLDAIKGACERPGEAPRSAGDLSDSRSYGSSATLNPDI